MASGFVLTLAVVAGAAAGVTTPAAAPTACLSAALALASIALVPERRARRAPLGVAALACLSAGCGALARDRALAPPIAAWFETVAGPDGRARDLVTVDGTLREDAAQVPGGVRLQIDVTAVRDADGWHRAPGRVQAHVAGALAVGERAAWTAGRRIRAPVLLRRPVVLANPGGPDPMWQALRRPFDLTGAIKSAALVDVERGAWHDELAARLRRFVRGTVAAYLGASHPRAAAIVTAILIGDRAGLSDEVERRLQVAGTYHVMAISGGNVALLCALLFGVLRVLVRSPRLGAIIAMLFVVLYGRVVGGDASVNRAVTAAIVYLGCGLAGLRPRPLHVLSLTALLVVAADLLTVIDVGAWLSFGATLAIVLCAGPIARRVRPAAAAPARSTPRSVFRRLGGYLLGVFAAVAAASLAAELALAPIAAAVFGRVGVAGLVLNFIAIPAMVLVQIGGMTTVVFGGLWASGAALAAAVSRQAADLLVGSASLVDAAPWLVWRVPPTPVVWTLTYYGSAVAGLAAGRARPRIRRAAFGAAGLSLFVVLSAPGLGWRAPPPGWLRFTMIDVGQGESLVVQFPSGHAMLIDAGGTPGSFDVGGRVVTPAVWAHGQRRVDWLVITHGDVDHLGGAPAATVDLAPREIWEGVPVPPHPDLAALQADARARRVVWRRIQAGDAFEVGGVGVEVVHPPRPEWERQRVRNDDSIVLRVRYGAVELLLTGDAGPEFERDALAEADLAPLRILKVGHHGSRTSTSAAFLARYAPQLALVSAGRGNLFGHPAPEVIGRLQRAGIEIFRTDEDGAVIVETDGHSVEVRSARGRTWSLGLWERGI